MRFIGRALARSRPLLVAVVGTLAICGPIRAHPLAPALLTVEVAAEGLAAIEWRVPLAVAARAPLQPVLPASCVDADDLEVSVDETSWVTRWKARCGSLSGGEEIEVRGLELTETDVLVNIRLADRQVARGVLSARDPVFEIPPKPSGLTVFRHYFELGIEHLFGGIDHLAFILGLLVLALRGYAPDKPYQTLGSLAGTVTAFTIGHSISLALSVLGVVRLPSGPIEVAIALSIVWVALQLATGPERGGRWPDPKAWRIAGGFGLLHGFGFAGALAEAGLPPNGVPTALLAFNLGLEVAQLALIVVAVPPLVSLARARPAHWPLLSRATGFVGGALATYWVLERGFQLA